MRKGATSLSHSSPHRVLRLAEVSMPDSKELRDWKKFTRRRSIHVDEDHYSFGCQLTKQTLLSRETRSSSSTEMLLTRVHLSSNTSHLGTNISPFIRYYGYVATATALREDGSFANSGQFSLTSVSRDNQCELAVLLLWPRMVLFRTSFKQQAVGHLTHSKFTSARTLYFCRQGNFPKGGCQGHTILLILHHLRRGLSHLQSHLLTSHTLLYLALPSQFPLLLPH